jgi:hypothetical protein
LNGGTLYGVRKRWNESGIKTTFGNAWTSNKQVARILSRWRNAGLIEHHDEAVGVAVWPRIVTQEEVAAVRAILRDPARRTTPGPAPKWLLSGIARCGRCSSPLRLGLQNGYGAKSYRCSGNDCYLAIPAGSADQTVISWLAEYIAQPPSRLDDDDELPARRKQLRTDLAQLAADEKALADSRVSFASALALAERLQTARTALQGELRALSAQAGLSLLLEELVPYQPGFGARMGDIMANEEAVTERFGALTLEQQRLLIQSLVDVRILPGTQDHHRLSPSDRVLIVPKASPLSDRDQATRGSSA